MAKRWKTKMNLLQLESPAIVLKCGISHNLIARYMRCHTCRIHTHTIAFMSVAWAPDVFRPSSVQLTDTKQMDLAAMSIFFPSSFAWTFPLFSPVPPFTFLPSLTLVAPFTDVNNVCKHACFKSLRSILPTDTTWTRSLQGRLVTR